MTVPRNTGNAHLESNLEKFFVQRVRLVGGYAFKWVPLIAGVPDRMVLFPGGLTAFVELKQHGKKPEPIQVVWHGRLRALGYEVAVIDTKEQAREWIAKMVDASGPQNGKPGPRPTT